MPQSRYDPQFKLTNIQTRSISNQSLIKTIAVAMPIIEKKSHLTHLRGQQTHIWVEEPAPQSKYAKQPQSLNPNSNKQTNKINIGSKFDQNQCYADADDWKEISFGTRQRLTNPHFSGRTRHHKRWPHTKNLNIHFTYDVPLRLRI